MSSTLEGFNALRQERFEASRGFRTLLGHDLLRFSNVTNNTGNCSDDRAFNNVIVYIHQDDRLLPALSRQQLKFLLALQFSLAYEANKPTGIHIQAFRPKGSAFQYVVQVHDAVHKLARVLDNIRNPKGSRFFTSLFSPLLDLLSPSNHSGLAMLPVAYVVEAVSQTLLEFGCQANVPDADNWTTEVKQISGLSPCLKMDITHHLQVASLKALKQSESERSRHRPASGGGGSPTGYVHPGWPGTRTGNGPSTTPAWPGSIRVPVRVPRNRTLFFSGQRSLHLGPVREICPRYRLPQGRVWYLPLQSQCGIGYQRRGKGRGWFSRERR
jgi:hypothetical protein